MQSFDQGFFDLLYVERQLFWLATRNVNFGKLVEEFIARKHAHAIAYIAAEDNQLMNLGCDRPALLRLDLFQGLKKRYFFVPIQPAQPAPRRLISDARRMLLRRDTVPMRLC